MKDYYQLKSTLPINEAWFDNLDRLPEKITYNIRFGGLYRFAYTMYSTFSDSDKKIFHMNTKYITKDIYNKYIHGLKCNYGCVHIRYGDKLCHALEEFTHTKYTPYMMPIYTPQYFIKQINFLLEKDIGEVVVLTDSVELVKKFILSHMPSNPKINLLDSNYLDAFYLLTKAKYIILSHSTLSFSAAYFNPESVCYLVKKYMMDPGKDYLYEDDALSPSWIIIDDRRYILNFDQPLLKEMVDYYGNCKKYLHQLAGKKSIQNNIVINNQKLTQNVIGNTVDVIDSTINGNLSVNGSLKFMRLDVTGYAKIYGNVAGSNGTFNKLNIYGTILAEKIITDFLLVNGKLKIDKLKVTTAIIAGKIRIQNAIGNNMELLTNDCFITNSKIKNIIFNNIGNSKSGSKIKPKIIITDSEIDNITIKGDPLTIKISDNTIIKKLVNGETSYD